MEVTSMDKKKFRCPVHSSQRFQTTRLVSLVTPLISRFSRYTVGNTLNELLSVALAIQYINSPLTVLFLWQEMVHGDAHGKDFPQESPAPEVVTHFKLMSWRNIHQFQKICVENSFMRNIFCNIHSKNYPSISKKHQIINQSHLRIWSIY